MFLFFLLLILFNSVSSELADSGAWFGDPASHAQEGKKIWVAGDDLKTQLDRVVGTKNPDALALALLSILFTREEIAGSNVTPPRTRAAVMLDPQKIRAIRCKLITLVVSSYQNPLAIFQYHSLYMSFPQCLITGHVNYKFPETDTAGEETRWNKIQTKLNNKCRDTEKALKKEPAEKASKKASS